MKRRFITTSLLLCIPSHAELITGIQYRLPADKIAFWQMLVEHSYISLPNRLQYVTALSSITRRLTVYPVYRKCTHSVKLHTHHTHMPNWPVFLMMIFAAAAAAAVAVVVPVAAVAVAVQSGWQQWRQLAARSPLLSASKIFHWESGQERTEFQFVV